MAYPAASHQRSRIHPPGEHTQPRTLRCAVIAEIVGPIRSRVSGGGTLPILDLHPTAPCRARTAFCTQIPHLEIASLTSLDVRFLNLCSGWLQGGRRSSQVCLASPHEQTQTPSDYGPRHVSPCRRKASAPAICRESFQSRPVLWPRTATGPSQSAAYRDQRTAGNGCFRPGPSRGLPFQVYLHDECRDAGVSCQAFAVALVDWSK